MSADFPASRGKPTLEVDVSHLVFRKLQARADGAKCTVKSIVRRLLTAAVAGDAEPGTRGDEAPSVRHAVCPFSIPERAYCGASVPAIELVEYRAHAFRVPPLGEDARWETDDATWPIYDGPICERCQQVKIIEESR